MRFFVSISLIGQIASDNWSLDFLPRHGCRWLVPYICVFAKYLTIQQKRQKLWFNKSTNTKWYCRNSKQLLVPIKEDVIQYRPVFIVIGQWWNVYWPIIGYLYCMTSFFVRHYKLLLKLRFLIKALKKFNCIAITIIFAFLLVN